MHGTTPLWALVCVLFICDSICSFPSKNEYSTGKDVSGHRLTYFLRPNVTRPDFFARSLLDTPPATDIDYSSHASTVNSGAESDAASVISIGIGSVLEEESEEEVEEEWEEDEEEDGEVNEAMEDNAQNWSISV